MPTKQFLFLHDYETNVVLINRSESTRFVRRSCFVCFFVCASSCPTAVFAWVLCSGLVIVLVCWRYQIRAAQICPRAKSLAIQSPILVHFTDYAQIQRLTCFSTSHSIVLFPYTTLDHFRPVCLSLWGSHLIFMHFLLFTFLRRANFLWYLVCTGWIIKFHHHLPCIMSLSEHFFLPFDKTSNLRPFLVRLLDRYPLAQLFPMCSRLSNRPSDNRFPHMPWAVGRGTRQWSVYIALVLPIVIQIRRSFFPYFFDCCSIGHLLSLAARDPSHHVRNSGKYKTRTRFEKITGVTPFRHRRSAPCNHSLLFVLHFLSSSRLNSFSLSLIDRVHIILTSRLNGSLFPDWQLCTRAQASTCTHTHTHTWRDTIHFLCVAHRLLRV